MIKRFKYPTKNPKTRMRKILLIICLLLIFGCDEFPLKYIKDDCINGSGNVIKETIDIDDFDKIDLSTSANIILSQEDNTRLIAQMEDNLLNYMDFEVKDKELTIKHKNNTCFNNNKPVNLFISMKEVEKLLISGSGEITGNNQIASDELELKISGSGDIDVEVDVLDLKSSILGSGDIELEGLAKRHDASIMGSGDIKAIQLETDKTDISITGSGNSEIDADELDITIAGSGDVSYKGNPELSSSVYGSGKINKYD